MFEDNPLEPSPFVFDTSDVFSNLADLDSFNFASPSSSSGHHSPAFSTIPTIAEPQSELNNAWFNFSNINDDALNAKTIASQPIPDTPWDFLTFANDSPDSGATSPFSPTFAIDPQLMATPATSKSSSDFGDDDAAKDEHPREEDDEEDDEEPVTPPPAKHSNKRKSAVLSGGVQKKVHVSSVVKTDPYDNASDDWRPTPDEYQKMSSREKRQLRNKISARNFRNRRKEYITTLEGDVAERDRLIDAIRTELGSTRSENAALQQEIKALKKALLSNAGHADSPVLPPPSPLPITPAASTSRSSASTSPLLTPNTHKDLPTTSPRLAAKGFWGGSSTPFGGITPVHTVTIPDLIAGAALKPALQENINPALNNSNNVNSVGLSTLGGPGKPAPFDSFMDTNPFTMKMLDAYRMQLWTRMAQQQQQQQHQLAAASQYQQQQHPSSPPLSGLAANLRPHYFSSTPTKRAAAAAPSLSSLLSGKHHPHTTSFTSATSASAYPTPPASPQPGSQMPTPQHAALATMASTTLVQRLGSAFWQAFSGSSSPYPPSTTSSNPAPGARAPAWDAEKVRRVLEGTAVVRVVDVDPPAVVEAAVAPKESKEVQTQAPPAQGHKGCVNLAAARDTGLSVLEESMRALTLGKK
jgi:hypothetical protein